MFGYSRIHVFMYPVISDFIVEAIMGKEIIHDKSKHSLKNMNTRTHENMNTKPYYSCHSSNLHLSYIELTLFTQETI